MDDIYENMDEYDWNKNWKLLIIFDDVIADILNNKKINPKVRESYIRRGKLNVSLVFVIRSYFTILKNIRLKSMKTFYENSKQTRASLD